MNPRLGSGVLRRLLWLCGVMALLHSLAAGASSPVPVLRTEDLFAPERWHNHGSCVVELPDGQLLAVWFHGSGERKADDVRIEGSRRSARGWSSRFVMADTPGYPDTNPSLFLDPERRLWLVYPTILANLWESALLKVHVASDYRRPGVPRWERQEILHVTPDSEFEIGIAQALPDLEKLAAAADWSPNTRREVHEYIDAMRLNATNRLYRRLGWMTRAHPQLGGKGRILVPLYHDGFSVSLFAYSDDGGRQWKTSNPLVGGGNIQPAVVTTREGHLVAYMRDNGPPPKRLMRSESHDLGATWGPVTDSLIPNPGSGADVIRLRDGAWLFVGNDTEEGRHRLSVWISEDDGVTWPWRAAIENTAGDSFSYPSAIQTRDGLVHVTYSAATQAGETIRHAQFPVAWVKTVRR